MARYIALLRAINVGGHVVKMNRLRALFEELGYANVATFIASGNVLFDSTSKSSAAIEKKIEEHLAKSLGYDVETFVRTPAELAATAALRPFEKSKQHVETNMLYVGFVKTQPAKDAIARLVALQTAIDEFRVHGREYFWSCNKTISQSKVTGVTIERALGMRSTMRNVTTVRKLAEL